MGHRPYLEHSHPDFEVEKGVDLRRVNFRLEVEGTVEYFAPVPHALREVAGKAIESFIEVEKGGPEEIKLLFLHV